jgi:hypothetical protein
MRIFWLLNIMFVYGRDGLDSILPAVKTINLRLSDDFYVQPWSNACRFLTDFDSVIVIHLVVVILLKC